jgi:hypothetical protein
MTPLNFSMRINAMALEAAQDGQIIVEVNALPVYAAFLFKIGLMETVNELLPELCYNYDRMDHGKTTVALGIYMFATKNHIISRIEDFVRYERFLKFIFPEIEPHHFSEGKISRTLSLLGEIGMDSLMFGITSNFQKKYPDIKTELFHLDTTNFPVSGAFEKQLEDDKEDDKKTAQKLKAKLLLATKQNVPNEYRTKKTLTLLF